jgi:ribosomal-protein-alanine N-acetyltransferase
MSCEKDAPQVTLDLMREADLPEILAIENESFPLPWPAAMFIKELNNANAQCLTARVNFGPKSVLGAYIIFWIVADEAHLHNLAVKKEFRRQSLAFHLLKAMQEIARQVGIRAQTLEVRQSNTAAIKLYEKCGFVVKGIRPLYYPETHEDALIMWADVKPRV